MESCYTLSVLVILSDSVYSAPVVYRNFDVSSKGTKKHSIRYENHHHGCKAAQYHSNYSDVCGLLPDYTALQPEDRTHNLRRQCLKSNTGDVFQLFLILLQLPMCKCILLEM